LREVRSSLKGSWGLVNVIAWHGYLRARL
jgi:hypothetical protein